LNTPLDLDRRPSDQHRTRDDPFKLREALHSKSGATSLDRHPSIGETTQEEPNESNSDEVGCS